MSVQKRNKTVFIGMSGGVDSSVAAHLLKEQGYEVVGVFLRSYNLDGCEERDAEDARRVAGHLGIPFYVWDVEKEYKEKVVDYMVRGYAEGITPNPDVMCNKEIKFGIFFKRAMDLGADYVATGHYIRLKDFSSTRFAPPATRSLVLGNSPLGNVKRAGRAESPAGVSEKSFSLYQATDKNKDQSYFLWALKKEQLKHCLFPIGDHLKSDVRKIAREAGIPTAEKKDSQGICFLGKITLSDFLKQHIPARKGEILNLKGEKVGEHEGVEFYTIGQRHIGAGLRNSSPLAKPYFVADKNIIENRLIVAESGENALHKKEVKLRDLNFLKEVKAGERILARVRYRQPLFEARLEPEEDSSRLVFGSPQKFVAPGQSAVLYSTSGELLGGGVIV